MDSSFSEQTQSWFSRLLEQGWIDETALQALGSSESASGDDLFAEGQRPLVVAFFGGTGVGKSTLLNRLAGEAIAKTGIERPTSREVTVYLHRSLPLEGIQTSLPWDRVKVARHRNDNRQSVVWIDMPDIDSVEQSNHALVLECMPHVDVLIYVVSPERYRDDSGWRLLREHGLSHAWLFVMNHWDQGDEVQIEDFTAVLKEGGFADPVVLRCDSRDDLAGRLPDDFGKLEELISRLVQTGGVKKLQARQHQLQGQRQAQQTRKILQSMGEPAGLQRVQNRWQKLWRKTLRDLEPSVDWSVQSLAREFAAKGRKPRESGESGEALLLDLWARKHLNDSLDRLILEATDAGMPAAPLKRRFDAYRSRMEEILADQVQRSLRLSLANPGRSWQRAGLWLTGTLRYLLPLGASGWVGWQVVIGYYRGFEGAGDYLGINFAIHSLLLIGLSWLIPFLLHRLLQPSIEKAAKAGIRSGYQAGFERIDQEVKEILTSLKEELTSLQAEGETLLAQLSDEASARPVALDPLLERMMIDAGRR